MRSFDSLDKMRRGLVLAGVALGATILAVAPNAVGAQDTGMNAPVTKAYIGLFKDNAVAVLDTSSNTVVKKIAIPTGPHGLVVTADGRWVYASSDGASTAAGVDTRPGGVRARV